MTNGNPSRPSAILRLTALTAAAVLATSSGPLQAASVTWLGGAGNWSLAANWSGAVVPAPGDDVRIDGAPGTASVVTLDVSDAVRSLIVDSSDRLLQVNARSLTLTAGALNNGTWSMGSAGSLTDLIFNGDAQTLGGTGELVLSDHSTNRVYTASAGHTLTQGENHSIRGAGQLGVNLANLVNQGTILAQGDSALVIDPRSTFTQDGVLEAQGAGGLVFSAGTFIITNGVQVADGSKLNVNNGAVVQAGALSTTGTGVVNANSSSTFEEVVLTAGSQVVQANGQAVTVKGGLTNNGTWSTGSAGSLTDLIFNGDAQTLGGTGELVLSDHSTNRVYTASAGHTLTQGENHSIRGAGQLGVNLANLVNQGTILADANQALQIDPRNFFRNQGTVKVTGAGGLVHVGDYQQTAGVTAIDTKMTVTGSGNLLLEGGVLSGVGEIEFTTPGRGVINSGGQVSAGASPGTLLVDGDYTQEAGGDLLVELDGDVQGVSYDLLLVDGDVSLAGALTVDLGFPADLSDLFTILTYTGTRTGTFDTLMVLAAGWEFDLIYDDLNQSVHLAVTGVGPAPVPLPAGVWLLVSALGLLAPRVRRS